MDRSGESEQNGGGSNAAIDALARLLVEMVVEQQTGRPCPPLKPETCQPLHEAAS